MTARCPRCQAALANGVCAACFLGGDDGRASRPPGAELASVGRGPGRSPGFHAGAALELEEPIGEGGMGQVFRARHARLGRTVAVKFLPPELAQDADFRRRFEREAQALARLSHPNIVTVHDCGEEDGQLYLVMEHAPGGTLAARIPLGPERTVRYARELAEALAYAHAHGIVHRDIKPANVLLDAEGRVKLTDFGVARFVGPHARGWTVTRADRVSGTPLYMAPEVIDGAEPDPRQDLFSLGVMMYEMASGRPPVGDFEPLPGPLDAIVRRLLSPDPARRHASAAELARELAALETGPSNVIETSGPPALADDELAWKRAVTVTLSVCTALWLWALFLSVNPRVIAPSEQLPLIMLDVTRLPDGRLVSWARFEILPLIAALFGFGVALLAHGLLEGHWRRAGLFAPAPDEPVTRSRYMVALGLFAIGLYALRKSLEAVGLLAVTRYMPILGGLVEITVVYLFWSTVLEARRRRRALAREPLLFLGLALALVPPVVDFGLYLSRWQP